MVAERTVGARTVDVPTDRRHSNALNRIHKLRGWHLSQTRGYQFSQDWFSHHIPLWERHLKPLADIPEIRGLEIGSFEGMSACWLLDHILTHPSARLTCIDPNFQTEFDVNIARAGATEKVTKLVGLSQDVLDCLPAQDYDLIYIDGNHTAQAVLRDALLCWRLIKVRGLMILDDYEWGVYPQDSSEHPKPGIDYFLSLLGREMEMVHKGDQVFIRKSLELASYEIANVVDDYEKTFRHP